MRDIPKRCWYCERELAIESIRVECAHCGADVARAYEWLDALDAARAEAERLKTENEHLYSHIERLEARAARQRVMLYRLQEAIERRNSEERIEAMRRALHDETVERYMREYDAAADEAERWKQQYEALVAELAAAREVVEVARRVANAEYDVDPADVHDLAEALRRYDECMMAARGEGTD